MKRQTNRKNSRKQMNAEVIYKAWNRTTRQMEQVTHTDEVEADEMVVPYFWCASANRYVTVPGTEVYGYVPQQATK